MSRRVRRLLLLGLAVGGLWALRQALANRAERGAGQSSGPPLTPPGPPALSGGHRAPALPPASTFSNLATVRSDTARPTPARVSVEVDSPPGDVVEPEPLEGAPVGGAPAPQPDAPPPVTPPAVTPGPVEPASQSPQAADDHVHPAGGDPGAEPAPGRRRGRAGAEPGNLDRVRERLASIQVDVPSAREAAAGVEVGAAARSRRSRRSERWHQPAENGTCDPSHPIKVKVRSGLFHLPGMFAYERTKADRCYRSAADAEADGFTRAKR
ncbi:MAG: hypothetical protein M3063_05540 [Actinomycetota bacterium]|nr:hypothetical protein [Actinomycetota bacterium]